MINNSGGEKKHALGSSVRLNPDCDSSQIVIFLVLNVLMRKSLLGNKKILV